MSSEASTSSKPSPATVKPKARRLQGACDHCIKCDSAKMPDGRCSNCISTDLVCPHTIPAKKRGPKGKHSKNVLNKAAVDSSQSPNGEHDQVGGTPDDTATVRLDDDGFEDPVLNNHLKKLCIDVADNRFFGLTSGHLLLRHGQLAKKECFENRMFPQGYYKRSQFWSAPSWEKPFIPLALPARFLFPPHDLLQSLVSSYFSKVNLIYPILHQPSFEDFILDGYHLAEPDLACIVLLVCALGAKYSDDPRVLSNPEHTHGLSSGWRWYEQVGSYRKACSPFSSSLYELQYHALAVLYLQASHTPAPTWTIIGNGVRIGIEIGLHRRMPRQRQKTAEDELKQRAFWVLVLLDRMFSTWLGRPCVIRDEDLDAEYPVECNDEYWRNDGTVPKFLQPPDKPSKITFFVQYLKLCEIISFAMLTVHAARRPKLAVGLIPDDMDQRLIKQLNMGMRQWLDNLPGHLRWKPRPEGDIFLPQSAFLYAVYYFTESQIQRPFFQENGGLRSISVGAAKSSLDVLHVLVEKNQVCYLPEIVFACFTSITVLLTDMWKTKKAKPDFNGPQAVIEAERAIKILRGFEGRHHLAGRLSDLLADLSVGLQLPLPDQEDGHHQPLRLAGDSTPSSSRSGSANGYQLPDLILPPDHGSRAPSSYQVSMERLIPGPHAWPPDPLEAQTQQQLPETTNARNWWEDMGSVESLASINSAMLDNEFWQTPTADTNATSNNTLHMIGRNSIL